MTTPILFVDHATQLGGAEQSLLLLMQHLDSNRWQPHVACPPGELADAALRLGIFWHNVHLPRLRRTLRVGLNWYQTSSAIAKIAGQIEAGAVVANTVRAAFFVSLAGKLGKRPFLWYMRDFWLSETEPRFHQVDTLLKKIVCRSAVQVIANSHITANHLPCPNVTIVPNGINLDKFPDDADGITFRQKFGIPANAPVVGTMGRLRPWKGQHHFIEMAAKVAQAQPQAHFIIVGGSLFGVGDAYFEQLQEMAMRNNLIEKVHFTGHLSEVADPLAAMDIFVHCGAPEPFGLVNIEAMAARKPVVAFRHGALPEIVSDNQTGRLVPPYNITALADAVSELIESPRQRKMMGEAGRARVSERFTIQQTAVQISQILQAVVNK